MFNRILVAYDGSELSRKALDKAISLATEQGASIVAAHVYQLPVFVIGQGYALPNDFLVQMRERARQNVAEAEKLLDRLPNSKAVLLEGVPDKEIVEYAEANGIDLIVMGSRGLGAIREMVLGSVSHRVVQHAKASVLVVKE
ncbi:universal stress protein [Cohnella faecalis]|uniref:Universal stress protein n=1 Tax=Cohnella faecalis TaxID=2315694 RepID=A0A398CG31_9BACL|nr:universal stress protein [Cohnella faecalis]RIE01460.1 universal stress protein [Cohnella faecalis]